MKKIHYAWWIMLSCCLLNIGILGIISYSAGIFYQPVVQELGIKTSEMGFHVTIRSLTMAAAMPIVGRILPRRSIGKILALATAVCCGSFALMSQFTAIWQWYIAAAVMGVSCGFLFFVPTPLLINNWFHKKSGLALGIALTASGLSGSVWTPLGNYLIETYGWRATYIIMACISAVLVIPAMLLLVRFQPADMGLLPYGITQDEWNVLPKVVMPIEKKRRALSSILADCSGGKKQFFFVLITCCSLSYCASYLQYLPSFAVSIGLDSGTGAHIASVAMVGSVMWKLSLGWMNDRWGAERSTLLGLVTVIISFSCILFLPGTPAVLSAAAFLYGAAPAIMAVSPSVVTKNVFGAAHFGEIYSYITIGTSLVTAAAASAIGAIYDISGSYHPGFLLGIGCCTASILFLKLAIKKPEKAV